jgi:hypothetical protein
VALPLLAPVLAALGMSALSGGGEPSGRLQALSMGGGSDEGASSDWPPAWDVEVQDDFLWKVSLAGQRWVGCVDVDFQARTVRATAYENDPRPDKPPPRSMAWSRNRFDPDFEWTDDGHLRIWIPTRVRGQAIVNMIRHNRESRGLLEAAREDLSTHGGVEQGLIRQIERDWWELVHDAPLCIGAGSWMSSMDLEFSEVVALGTAVFEKEDVDLICGTQEQKEKAVLDWIQRHIKSSFQSSGVPATIDCSRPSPEEEEVHSLLGVGRLGLHVHVQSGSVFLSDNIEDLLYPLQRYSPERLEDLVVSDSEASFTLWIG